jgi:ABC-2 type transport system ATP-binding protein
MSAAAIETARLGKRYGALWALQDCTVTVPRGRVSALIGPNGAGKTTLLRLLVGLARPSAGTAAILDRAPSQDAAFLAEVGYLAQDVPLYKRLTAQEHIDVGGRLNARWDAAGARERLDRLRVPVDRPVSTLSGGQRAQVGLGLALAKRPSVLLLDEPVAALDPLARREFLAELTTAVAEADGELTVVLSSHLVHDIEQVCDHMVLLGGAHAQVCDDIEHVLATHRMLTGPRKPAIGRQPGFEVVKATHTASQTRLLARLDAPVLDPAWDVAEVGLEDVVLAYMSRDMPADGSALVALGAAS